jgi:hypothetical protein
VGRVSKMDEAKSVIKIREQLYDDVWAEPMTAVAKKYNLSDNGLRKRCKSLNIPIPPFGYWPKKKAGKVVAERPALPPYNEIVLDESIQEDEKEATESLTIKKIGSLELRDLDEMQIEQVAELHDLDLIAPESREYFNNWLDSIVVPGRIISYDNLISSHKTELEYREARDKAYPFREDRIKLWSYRDRINERDNISVLPIEVSGSQLGRAYRIADTIIKAFRKLKSNISVTKNEKDNICIELLSSKVSFEISESRTKRRHLANLSDLQDFRPLYEEIYDGNIQIRWQINGYEEYDYYSRYSNSNKGQASYLDYSDSKDSPLEDQISLMILEVYKECCGNELKHTIEKKKRHQQYVNEEKERHQKEEAQKMHKLEEKKQAQKNSLVSEIVDHANNWFKHEKLSRYADELETFLTTCSDEETVLLMQIYIQIVRDNADKFNPINHILGEMRAIKSQDDNS